MAINKMPTGLLHGTAAYNPTGRPAKRTVALKCEGPGIHDDQRPARFRFAKALRHQLLQVGTTCGPKELVS